jgi:integrase
MRGEGRIYQRGDVLWIAYYAPCDGTRHEPVAPCGRSHEEREPAGRSEKEARALLKQRRQALAVHRAGLRPFQGPRQEKVTLAELLDGLEKDHEVRGRKGLAQLKSHLKHVRAFFAVDRALSVTASRLREYIGARQAEGAAPGTINRELEGVARAFALAVEAGTVGMAPKVPSLREDNARQGFFERGDFEAVLSNINDPDLVDYLRWFWWTGMRPGEIRSLTWASLDTETWSLRLHARDAKTGHGRVLGLIGDLKTIIERRIKARRLDSELIFHRAGQPVGEFKKTWATACDKAGLAVTTGVGKAKKVKPLRLVYDLRRTAVRNMVRAGVDPAVAMKISGHRTRAVFDRYNIIDERDLREAMERTAAYVESLPARSNITPLRAAK